ncbi:dolichol kinase [Fictibacillus barbaricus]|uniref:Dolichol kinase n=1 Tax=Fictibacillus barbaricus TaxID=182136 RepID=A0ABU1U1Y3_9BACL|nr:dolichol kinase [Fictibacillus barbaricus]
MGAILTLLGDLFAAIAGSLIKKEKKKKEETKD